MLTLMPFTSITENLMNLMGEAAGSLPLAIAIFGKVDPATCELGAVSQASLIVSAFLGIISQIVMLALEFLPLFYGVLVGLWVAIKRHRRPLAG
jgi:hypothetical protein